MIRESKYNMSHLDFSCLFNSAVKQCQILATKTLSQFYHMV
jgi:hypothetical protein